MTQTQRCFLALILVGLLSGCSFEITKGSGVAATEKRTVGDFKEVELGSAIHLDLVVGPATSLEVTTDDNIMPQVVTELAGERLKIHVKGNSYSGLGVKVKATTPSLTALHSNGATQTTLTGVDAKLFVMNVNGASNVKFAGKADQIDLTVNGASKCTLTGEAKNLTVVCSGASQVNSLDLSAETVKATVNGASSAQIRATQDLTAKALGASKITYAGTPGNVKTDVGGASTIGPK